AGVDATAGVVEAFDQARLDRRMTVFEALVEHERTPTEVVGERGELATDARQFVRRQDADALQALGVRAAGGNVVEEELAIEDHVVAGQEGLDLRVDGDAGFLPEQVGHGDSRVGWTSWPLWERLQPRALRHEQRARD